MKLGIINNKYTAGDFDMVKSLGLEFIEVCCNYDPDCERLIENVTEIKANIARTGIPMQSIGRWNSLPLAEGKIDENVRGLLFRFMDAIAEIGAPVMVCSVNYDESVSLYKNYTLAIEYLGSMVERAKKYGIKIAVNNCDWNNFIIGPKQWEVVHNEVEGLTIKYDPSHAYYRNCDYLAEMNEWIGRVSHMHIKGTFTVNGKRTDDPPAGMDEIEWNRVFALLYKYGYNEGLSIEPHSSTWKGELGEAGVKFTINHIKPFILK